ncbi:tetratricopeptide repeat protein [Acetobacter persici]|uniref:tetratricopeptide repeat protein n=1 Tax=Acetobacter persici TaxID=1076596 RepID=UPI001BA4D35A|nr:tetratricopeptide repeat protein [Acetobacter persici]MBS1017300.1 tetratricopeptide repeat protein [Acetobacter persici]
MKFKTHQASINEDVLTMFLWEWGEINHRPHEKKMRFGKDHKIYGLNCLNEVYWDINDGVLVIKNINKHLSWNFLISIVDEGKYNLISRPYFNPDWDTYFYLLQTHEKVGDALDDNDAADQAIFHRLNIARQKTENDDLEEASEDLQSLWKDFPNSEEVGIEYAISLNRLNKKKEADIVLSIVKESHPSSVRVVRIWATQAAEWTDYLETIRRIDELRKDFPPQNYPIVWDAIGIEIDILHDHLQIDKIQKIYDEYFYYFQNDKDAFNIGVRISNTLMKRGYLSNIISNLKDELYQDLPQNSLKNLKFREDSSIRNEDLLKEWNVSVTSIGQNCLPYLLLSRWGLMTGREDVSARTPFDLGGFRKDTVAEAIANDFATYKNPSNYISTTFWGGPMVVNKVTDVGFVHERGLFWISENFKHFHQRMSLLIENWDHLKSKESSIFVFCLCGECNIQETLTIIYKKLLKNNSRIFVLNVLKQDVSEIIKDLNLPNIDYLHLPYPDGYVWTDPTAQISNEGTIFEYTVAEAILQSAKKIS